MVRLGSIYFNQSLKWLPKNEDVRTIGSDTPTFGGVVSVRLVPQEEYRTYQFGQITFSDWRELKKMVESSFVYDFKPTPDGPTYRVRFAQKDPLVIYDSDADSERIRGGEVKLIFPVKKQE